MLNCVTLRIINMKKWYFVAICFILAMLLCCLGGCSDSEPKQSTKPGEFGHYIYKKAPNNIVEWRIQGMYLNDSLIVLGNPQYIGYKYPIFNKNSGKIVGCYEISKK